MAHRALRCLGNASGAVIAHDSALRVHWLVGPGSVKDWPPLEGVRVLDSRDGSNFVAVPRMDETRGPNPYWAGHSDRYLTDAGHLLRALKAAQ